jgi:peroxiredoxin
MLQVHVGRIELRSMIVGTFSIAVLLSLVCGLAAQEGHAGSSVAESAETIEPLKAGHRAPTFKVRTASNEEFVFDPDSLERPAIIITFRGGWCPYCNMHLSELHTVLPDISAMGVDVLFLSGDRPDMLYASLAADTKEDIAGLDYRIYSDADAEAAIALGIAFKASSQTINRRAEKGQDIAASSMLNRGVLPVPAVYAIDRTGVIQFDFVEPDYKVRLPADDLLAVAREIVQQDSR